MVLSKIIFYLIRDGCMSRSVGKRSKGMKLPF